MSTQNKAIGGALGAAVGASPIGDSIAEIVLWAMAKVPGLDGIPNEAVQVLIVAVVAYGFIYFSPKNQAAA